MLTINKIFPQEKIPEKTESFLFFDIETTGFSRDNTILPDWLRIFCRRRIPIHPVV